MGTAAPARWISRLRSKGGCNVGWTEAGEWLEYEVRVAQAADFDLTLRLASAGSNKRVSLLVDGQSVGSLTAPASGWQAWQDRTISGVHLSQGQHTLRVVFETGGVNFDYLSARSADVPDPGDQEPNGKPNVWILTDMSDPRLGVNDPDDVVAMAMYLLNADRFNTASVTVASTHRSRLLTAPNQATWASGHLGGAYAKAQPCLQAQYGGYPSTVPWRQSSLSTGDSIRKFRDQDDYANLNGFPSVRALVDYARENPVFVLAWGPLTEAAMAVKHLKTRGDAAALRNVTIISHWTTSYIAQGTPQAPFEVANCKDDRSACDYLHQQARSDADVKFYDLGSIGQTGIVSGSPSGYNWSAFRSSSLGEIYVDTKFAYGKPDGSDAATFYALMGDYGVTLASLNDDGTLSKAIEERSRDLFRDHTRALLDDLLERSAVAARCE